MILSLDISSSITGICVLDGHGNIVHTSSVYTKNKNKYPDVYECAGAVSERLQEIHKNFNIEKICIEESLKSFTRGKSSAHTLIILSKMNAMVFYECMRIFDIKPETIDAQSARRLIELDTSSDEDIKDIVLSYVEKTEKGFSYDLTRSGNPKPEAYDRADAILLARAYEKMLT